MTKALTGGRVRLATVAAGVGLLRLIMVATIASATVTSVRAQDISINFGQGSGLTERVLQLGALMTVLSPAYSSTVRYCARQWLVSKNLAPTERQT